MPKYRISFSREEYGFVYFDALSLDDAVESLRECEEGSLDIEELPNFEFKIKGGGESFDTFDVEELP